MNLPTTGPFRYFVSVIVLLIVTGFDPADVLAQSTPQQNDTTIRELATKLTGFSIPFKLEQNKESYIEVQLYVSDDQGSHWNFYGSQDVDQGEFNFQSNGDGEYWFALKTLDRNRKLLPPGNIVRPELKITVDTVQPKLEFQIRLDAAGRIVSSWKAMDADLDVSSMRLLHRNGGDKVATEWIPVNVRPMQPVRPTQPLRQDVYVEEFAWWPTVSGPDIEVAFEISDRAGNLVKAKRITSLGRLNIPRTGTNSTLGQSGLRQGHNFPSPGVVCENGVCRLVDSPRSTQDPLVKPSRPGTPSGLATRTERGRAGPPILVGSKREFVAPPVPAGIVARTQNARPDSSRPSNPSSPPSIVWKSKENSWTGQKSTQDATTKDLNHFPLPRNRSVQLAQRRQSTTATYGSNADDGPIASQIAHSKVRQEGDLQISESTTIGRGRPDPISQNLGSAKRRRSSSPPNASRGPSPTPQRHIRPNAQLVASRPQELADKQNTDSAPKLSVNESQFNLNYGIQAIDPSGVGEVILWATEDQGQTWQSWARDPDRVSPFPVQVKHEGVFGFRVVIHSRDGLTGKPPSPGDVPDVWVHVDLTAPTVAITSAPYGSGQDAGKLLIHWEAFDQFLALRPIEIAYSPTGVKPWTTIEAGVRNTGTYTWNVPRHVPETVFLRLRVRDLAGNMTTSQTSSPIDLSGLVPRGKIFGVQPIGPPAR